MKTVNSLTFAVLIVSLQAAAQNMPGDAVYKRSCSVADTFPERTDRDQRDVGACTYFASIAVLESALFRSTGKHYSLSEADLIVQKSLNDNAGDADFMWRIVVNHAIIGDLSLNDFDSIGNGEPDSIMSFAIEHGVAESRYSTYESLAGFDPTNPLQDRLKMYKLEMMRRLKDFGTKIRAQAPCAPSDVDCLGTYVQMSGLESPHAVGSREDILLAPGDPSLMKQIRESRLAIRDLLHGGKIGPPIEYDPTEGQKASAWILTQLDSHRPIQLNIMYRISRDDGTGDLGHVGHALIIKGYHWDQGKLFYDLRNSWGNSAARIKSWRESGKALNYSDSPDSLVTNTDLMPADKLDELPLLLMWALPTTQDQAGYCRESSSAAATRTPPKMPRLATSIQSAFASAPQDSPINVSAAQTGSPRNPADSVKPEVQMPVNFRTLSQQPPPPPPSN